ncbi:sugar transferase [Flavobacterium paronense]|uniref:Sugar transferase n=1 Tax=Flavobacterium paronense TaxID=1392775 RepID=A0ABV5GAP6_9FLAO|nr:sugar transferase [Flavobacterium paronense]MDN3676683.1 sugar transferase [Flavobacterium paronense]
MYRYFFKRVIDLFIAIFAFILVTPILFLTFILIKIDSEGPIFFLQERLGVDKKIFKVIKLRTMTNKKRDSHVQVYENNPEVTKLGVFLRRTKIDELPQIINVLKGDMAIVGPRPCLPTIEHLFDDNTPKRFEVRPGVTSLAGVSGSIYLSWPEKWYYDKIYVERLTFLLDIKIIFMTALVVVVGEKKFLKRPELKNK